MGGRGRKECGRRSGGGGTCEQGGGWAGSMAGAHEGGGAVDSLFQKFEFQKWLGVLGVYRLGGGGCCTAGPYIQYVPPPPTRNAGSGSWPLWARGGRSSARFGCRRVGPPVHACRVGAVRWLRGLNWAPARPARPHGRIEEDGRDELCPCACFTRRGLFKTRALPTRLRGWAHVLYSPRGGGGGLSDAAAAICNSSVPAAGAPRRARAVPPQKRPSTGNHRRRGHASQPADAVQVATAVLPARVA